MVSGVPVPGRPSLRSVPPAAVSRRRHRAAGPPCVVPCTPESYFALAETYGAQIALSNHLSASCT
jgi:hypothetical protein